MRQKGFTLIELLIVIALIGALAVGLLATIDPIEQINKGRDSALQSQVREYYNANLRYYVPQQQYSMMTTNITDNLTSAYGTASLTNLINAGELKSNFTGAVGTANLAKIYFSSTSSVNLVVCYQPISKSFKSSPEAMYNNFGGTDATCNANSTSLDCYICYK